MCSSDALHARGGWDGRGFVPRLPDCPREFRSTLYVECARARAAHLSAVLFMAFLCLELHTAARRTRAGRVASQSSSGTGEHCLHGIYGVCARWRVQCARSACGARDGWRRGDNQPERLGGGRGWRLARARARVRQRERAYASASTPCHWAGAHISSLDLWL